MLALHCNSTLFILFTKLNRTAKYTQDLPHFISVHIVNLFICFSPVLIVYLQVTERAVVNGKVSQSSRQYAICTVLCVNVAWIQAIEFRISSVQVLSNIDLNNALNRHRMAEFISKIVCFWKEYMYIPIHYFHVIKSIQ